MVSVNRRAFLADLGKGVTGALVLAACSPQSGGSTSAPYAGSPATGVTDTTSAGLRSTSTVPPPTGDADPSPAGGSYDWADVDLGFVSAYLLVRDGAAVLVDTGVADSESAIEAVLGELGLGWGDVGHVIVTHEHGDHQGSVRAVLDLAPAAAAYAAQPDLGNIASRRPVTEVVDGDMVEGLQVIATPGHTAGHIAILDPGRILLTGDAINNVDGNLTGPNPRFSSDLKTGIESAKLLASFEYEVALFGHGIPIDGGASSAVAALATSL